MRMDINTEKILLVVPTHLTKLIRRTAKKRHTNNSVIATKAFKSYFRKLLKKK